MTYKYKIGQPNKNKRYTYQSGTKQMQALSLSRALQHAHHQNIGASAN